MNTSIYPFTGVANWINTDHCAFVTYVIDKSLASKPIKTSELIATVI